MKTILFTTAFFLILTACQPAAPDYEAQYRPLIDKFLEAYSTGNVEVVDDVYAPTAVRHSTTELVGLEAIKKEILVARSRWPSLKIGMVEAVYSPEKVAFHWWASALDTRTNKELEVDGVSIFTIAENKVIEDWRLNDFLSGYQRLGYTLTPPAVDTTGAGAGEGEQQ